MKFVMSHESGKIEIAGVDDRHIYLRYHQAKHARDEGRFIVCKRDNQAYWLDQLQPVGDSQNDYYRRDIQAPASWN